jgi:hypothetical protein
MLEIQQKSVYRVMDTVVRGYEDVFCDVAKTERQKKDRLAVVTKRYLDRGYITPDDSHMEDGVYVDEYEKHSIPFLAVVENTPVGSLRLIQNTLNVGLPINNDPHITIFSKWRNKVENAPFELSQLSKSRGASRDTRSTYALIRAYFAYSRQNGFEQAVAVADNHVLELLNGAAMSFGLPSIGEPHFYMGSISIPIYIDIPTVIANTAKSGKRDLAQFLDTGMASGFEWYHGI